MNLCKRNMQPRLKQEDVYANASVFDLEQWDRYLVANMFSTGGVALKATVRCSLRYERGIRIRVLLLLQRQRKKRDVDLAQKLCRDRHLGRACEVWTGVSAFRGCVSAHLAKTAGRGPLHVYAKQAMFDVGCPV